MKKTLLLSKNEYETIIKNTQKQLAKDDSRPILKNIYIKTNGNNLEAVAVDGFMLSKVNITTLANNGETEFLITPNKIDKTTETICLEQEDKTLKTIQLSNTGKTEQTQTAINGEFINYNQILTNDYKNEMGYSGILFNSKLMIEVLKDMPIETKIYIPQNKLKPIYFIAKTEDGGTITKILLPIRERA